MAKFVKCFDGTWLNLEFIAKIVPAGEGKRGHKFMAADGSVVGEVLDFDPAYLMPVVPALPGEALLEFYAISTERFYAISTERRPTSFKDIVVNEMPILGWRCGESRATPITYRPYLDRGASMYLYRLADGRFKDEWREQPLFEDLEAAKAYALKRIQEQWP